MNTRIAAAAVILVGLLAVPAASRARPIRPTLIPNGTVHGCFNCHFVFGGGPRNPFGHEIEEHFLTPLGMLNWGPELAALDSDGDGRTNGQELLDPQGAWRAGDPNPGNPAEVTNPGVPDAPPPRAVPARSMAGLTLLAGLLMGVGMFARQRQCRQ
jgi:hypothetical protein